MKVLKTLYSSAVCALLLCPSLFANEAAVAAPVKPPVTIVDSSEIIVNAIMKSPIPVLVDFWAPWCAPCRMLKPIIEDIEKKYKNKIVVIRLNVDDYQQLAQMFGVSGIPAIFLLNNGKSVDNVIGMQPAERYELAVENALAAHAAAVKKDTTIQNSAEIKKDTIIQNCTDTTSTSKSPDVQKADTTSKNKSSKKSGKH
jgi:thioredoxin 1